MNADFRERNFMELLGDAFYDGARISGTLALTRTTPKVCRVCGCISQRAKCDPCFRAYRVERHTAYYRRKTVKRVTQSQLRVLDALRTFMGEHDRAPSFDELGDIVGVGKSTIHDHLHSLQRSGYLTYEKGKARTIRLTEAA